MRRKMFRRLSTLFLAVALAAGMLVVPAAAQKFDSSTYGRIEILAISDGTRLDNVTFDAWLIGGYDAGTGHGLYEKYQAYGLDAASDNFAGTLRDYLMRDGVAPDLKAISGTDGRAAFEGLGMGSYLICAEGFQRDGYRYSGVAMLVRLPYLTDNNGSLDAYAELEAKFERRRIPDPDVPGPGTETITRRVLKVWEDDDDAAGKRPSSVRAELLRDGRSYDVRRLSEENDWSYTWYGLDASHRWTVVEHASIPGYITDVEKHGRTYVLTNRFVPDIPEPVDPGMPELPVPPVIPVNPVDPVPPGPGTPEIPTIPVTPGTPDPGPGPGPNIPQTGNPMWIVTVMTGIGLALVCVGVILKRRRYGGDAGLVVAIVGIVFIALSFSGMLYFQYEAATAGQDMPDLSEYVDVRPSVLDMTDPEVDVPDYVLNPDMAMPLSVIDGQAYCGRLDIVSQALSLPVLGELTYPGLKISPARYSGSAYDDDLVVGAHNYDRHFGRLKYLSSGDELTFTDMDGNVFYYNVTAVETLKPSESERLVADNPGLTLFTCTYGGRSRVVVRCTLDTFKMPDWSVLFDSSAAEI